MSRNIPLPVLIGLTLAGAVLHAAEPSAPKAPAASAAPGAGAASASAGEAPAQIGLVQSLIGGKVSAMVRYRFEVYDSEDPALPDASVASTFRFALGYETSPYLGFSALGQFEGVGAMGSDEYRVPNHRYQNLAGHPVIADPEGSEINQAFLKYANPAYGAQVKLGRQEIVLNNARFISNSGWRQNNMTYDAALASASPVKGLALTYIHILKHNRVSGKDALDGEMEMSSNVFNAAYKLADRGGVYAYGLLLDYETAYRGNSSNTFGARLEGPFKLTPEIGLLYAGEYAKQDKAANRTAPLDAYYWLAEGGLAYKGLGLKAGYNVRSGSAADGQFNTPLSHPWDSWTELFLNTPPLGLETFALTLAGPVPGAPGLSVSSMYLHLKAASAAMTYGDEVNVGAEYRVLPLDKNLVVGARYANYMEDGFSADALRYSAYAFYAF